MPSRGTKTLLPLLLVLVLSGGLRLWGLGSPPDYAGDERWQVPVAKSYVRDGQTNDTIWHHPPFGILLLAGSMDIFGDNPYGWRMRNAALGSLSAGLLFLVALEIFGNLRVAFLSGLLLALDPLHIAISRLTFDEIPAIFFSLLGLLFALQYLKRRRNLLPAAAGAAIGFSLASKFYFVFGAGILFFFCLQDKDCAPDARPHRLLYLFLALLVIPVAVYVLSYFPWFGRGNSFSEFARFQADSFGDLASMTHAWFRNDIYLSKSGRPVEWFVIPRMFGMQLWQEDGVAVFNFSLNNPPVWLLVRPSFFFLGYRCLKNKDRVQMLWLALFCSIYIPLISTGRVIYLYSATAVLPFVFSFVAYFMDALLVKAGRKRWVYPALLALLLSWSLYVYPLVTFKKVPLALYGPVTAFARVYHAF